MDDSAVKLPELEQLEDIQNTLRALTSRLEDLKRNHLERQIKKEKKRLIHLQQLQLSSGEEAGAFQQEPEENDMLIEERSSQSHGGYKQTEDNKQHEEVEKVEPPKEVSKRRDRSPLKLKESQEKKIIDQPSKPVVEIWPMKTSESKGERYSPSTKSPKELRRSRSRSRSSYSRSRSRSRSKSRSYSRSRSRSGSRSSSSPRDKRKRKRVVEDEPPAEYSLFVTELPRSITEEDLKAAFAENGPLEVNVPKNRQSGNGKGFGFVKFYTQGDLDKALRMEPPEFKDDVTGEKKPAVVKIADPRNKLHISNLPRKMEADALEDEIAALAKFPVVKFELVSDDRGSRGYAFCTYKDHTTALAALKALNKQEIGGHSIVADMAESKPAREKYYRGEQRTLFIKGVAHSVTESQLRELFGEGAEKIVIPVDRTSKNPLGHAFAHFKTREDADLIRSKFHDYDLEGRRLFIDWSQPQKKYNERFKDDRYRRGRGGYGPMRHNRGYGYRERDRDRDRYTRDRDNRDDRERNRDSNDRERDRDRKDRERDDREKDTRDNNRENRDSRESKDNRDGDGTREGRMDHYPSHYDDNSARYHPY